MYGLLTRVRCKAEGRAQELQAALNTMLYMRCSSMAVKRWVLVHRWTHTVRKGRKSGLPPPQDRRQLVSRKWGYVAVGCSLDSTRIYALLAACIIIKLYYRLRPHRRHWWVAFQHLKACANLYVCCWKLWFCVRTNETWSNKPKSNYCRPIS